MDISLEKLLLKNVNELIGLLTGNFSKYSDLQSALIHCINVKNRIPSTRKWNVVESDFLQEQRKTLSPDILNGLQKFVNSATGGEDLSPWLHNAIFETKQDPLMNDWAIQHYHLGLAFKQGKRGRKMINRTGQLLYAVHREESHGFHLIGIFDHKSFSEKQLLKIIAINWPTLLAHSKIENLVDISCSPSSEEIHQCRKNQINSAVDVNGDFLINIGGGYTLSGHSAKSVLQALSVQRVLRNINLEIKNNPFVASFCIRDRSIFLTDETNDRYQKIL